MPESLAPTSARDLAALLVVAAGMLGALLSLLPPLRVHALRVSAVLLVAGLAMLANDPWVSLASILIVATIITETDFLQNLAAIIRGSDAYFKHRTELLTPRENAARIEDDQTDELLAGRRSSGEAPAAEPVESEVTASGPNVDDGGAQDRGAGHQELTATAEIVEQLTVVRLEGELGRRIDRGVRFQRGGRSLVVDAASMGRHGDPDKIVEIKLVRRGSPSALASQIPSLLRKTLDYREITGRDANLVLAIVVPRRDVASKRARRLLHDRLSETGQSWSLFVFTYDDIGLPMALRGSDTGDE